MMNIYINHIEVGSSAAIVGSCPHQGFMATSLASNLLIDFSKIGGSEVNKNQRDRKPKKTATFTDALLFLNYVNLFSRVRIANRLFYKVADILQFHNLHFGYLDHRETPVLLLECSARVVW